MWGQSSRYRTSLTFWGVGLYLVYSFAGGIAFGNVPDYVVLLSGIVLLSALVIPLPTGIITKTRAWSVTVPMLKRFPEDRIRWRHLGVEERLPGLWRSDTSLGF